MDVAAYGGRLYGPRSGTAADDLDQLPERGVLGFPLARPVCDLLGCRDVARILFHRVIALHEGEQSCEGHDRIEAEFRANRSHDYIPRQRATILEHTTSNRADYSWGVLIISLEASDYYSF